MGDFARLPIMPHEVLWEVFGFLLEFKDKVKCILQGDLLRDSFEMRIRCELRKNAERLAYS